MFGAIWIARKIFDFIFNFKNIKFHESNDHEEANQLIVLRMLFIFQSGCIVNWKFIRIMFWLMKLFFILCLEKKKYSADNSQVQSIIPIIHN